MYTSDHVGKLQSVYVNSLSTILTGLFTGHFINEVSKNLFCREKQKAEDPHG